MSKHPLDNLIESLAQGTMSAESWQKEMRVLIQRHYLSAYRQGKVPEGVMKKRHGKRNKGAPQYGQ